MPNIMPGFDREIAKLAQRLLIQGRPIDYHTNVIASKVTPGACCFDPLPGWLAGGSISSRAAAAERLWGRGHCCAGHNRPLPPACLATRLPTRPLKPRLSPSPCPCFPAGVPGVKPVRIELTDFTTKEVVDELEVGEGRWCAGLCRLQACMLACV